MAAKFPGEIKPEHCAGCRLCELRCSFREVGEFHPAKALIRVTPRPGGFTVAAEESCKGCGLCIAYCAYGALTPKKKQAHE